MPRHPPCALKNLPHDHRTHRYHHHHTKRCGSGLSAINHEHGTTTTPGTPFDPYETRTTPGPLRHPFLRCSRPLYSSQTTTRTPHTLVAAAPHRGHDHRQDAGNPDTTPPPPHQGTGPVVSGPNSAPRTTPTTGAAPFHHPHRANPQGSTTVGQVLGPDPAGNPHPRRTRRTGGVRPLAR